MSFTSPGDLHDPGIKAASLVSALAGRLPLCYPYSNAKQKVKKKKNQQRHIAYYIPVLGPRGTIRNQMGLIPESFSENENVECRHVF